MLVIGEGDGRRHADAAVVERGGRRGSGGSSFWHKEMTEFWTRPEPAGPVLCACDATFLMLSEMAEKPMIYAHVSQKLGDDCIRPHRLVSASISVMRVQAATTAMRAERCEEPVATFAVRWFERMESKNLFFILLGE